MISSLKSIEKSKEMAADLSKKGSVKADLLAQFGENLWLSQRLQCCEIVKFLQEIKIGDEGERQRLVAFIKFLEAECNGANFVLEKQWSELLNLMQISRKLNHRTVKLKDIIRNQQIIEDNERLIKQFNLAANASKTIENSLEQLEALLQAGYLETDDGNDLLAPQLLQAKVYLESRCCPILSILKLELDDDLVTSSSSTSRQIVVWRQKVERHEQVVVSLIKFIGNMIKFESKLAQLRPMLGATDESSSGSQKSELVKKIETCRQLFLKSHQIHSNLSSEIRNQSGAQKRVLLLKLAGPANVVVKNQENLEEAIQYLVDCQLVLDEVLRTLRLEFGRFYFVSDLELLTVITLDWRLIMDNCVQNRQIISKLFNNSIESFVVSNKEQVLTQIKTPYGEMVTLKGEPVVMRKKVNVYSLEIVRIFNELLRRLRKTLRQLLFEQLSSNQDQNFVDKSLPVQVMNLVEHVRFCSRVEEAIKKDTINSLIQLYNSKFAILKSEEFNSESWLDNYKSTALISVTVHFLTQLTKLKGVKSCEDWRWTKQVRYYHLLPAGQRAEEELEVRIGGAEFLYRFNFLALQTNNQQQQANFKRLISTESSDRCFLVASTAVGNFRLGACPYGPAGSGKTETIKALGHLLGCQVIVHNCDESNQSESLDRLIWGLAHAGLWGCFDEFNRLSPSALSSVSSTLELVQASIRENRLNAELPDGSFMCIDQASAFFVTLNPQTSDNKYRGRRQLPANMRHLFMPVAMIRVEIESIVSELLLTMQFEPQKGGPEESMEVGKTLASWLEWMRLNLNSCQGRVEWDLRLVMAILKRLKLTGCGRDTREMLVQSFFCEVACRLDAKELKILQLGPCGSISVKPELSRAKDDWSVKELEAQLETRAGVILLGPSQSGKSLTWRRLVSKMGTKVKWFALNPRACERNKLLGRVELETRKWVDGQLTARVREASKILQTNVDVAQVWIILDGPIDPDWIESLNSVLDDNHVLTLSGGEHLDFLINAADGQCQKSIKLIFETIDISYASPATISRLGLVYHEGKGIDLEDQKLKQLESLTEFIGSRLDRLCALIGGHPISRVKVLAHCGGVLYNCSESSNSNHLVELVEKFSQAKLFILTNIDLVKSRDSWGATDLWELLRFMTTYGGHYSDQNRFMPSDAKFIISSQSLEPLDERLKSRLTSLVLHREETHHDVDLEFEGVNLKVFQQPIICLKLETRELNQKEKIIHHLIQHDGDWELLTFSSSSLVERSIDTLKEALDDEVQVRKKLFIMEDFECCLMNPKSRCNLFHYLNFLQIKKLKTIKFVFLMWKSHKDELFWSSLSGGDIYRLRHCSPSPNENLEGYFNEKVNVRWREHSKWLARKVMKYLKDYEVDLTDCQRVELLKKMIVGLIEKSTLSLDTEQRTLSSGLDRLSEFELSVEQIRRRCQLQENELMVKKEHISKMMLSIDAALNESQQRKGQIAKLKEEQQVKTREIERKSKLVEEELGQVSALVETSKAEVARHLKPEALNEIKALRSPPKTIKDILDVLFVFLNLSHSSNSWSAMKSQLSRVSLRDELNNYDFKRNLNEDLLNQVKGMMADGERASSFTDLQASRASKAVVPILGWIRATLEFGEVLVRLRPLRQEMDSLQVEFKNLEQRAQDLEDQSARLVENIKKNSLVLAQLESEFEESQISLGKIKVRLQEAVKTRSDLGGQVERWRTKLEKINSRLSFESNLVKVCSAAAALSCYHHQLAGVEPLLDLFDLNCLKINEFVELAIDLFQNDADEGIAPTKLIKPNEIGAMLQLMIMKICLMPHQNSLVPFLDLNSGNRRIAAPQLVQYLGASGILAKDEKMIAIVKLPRAGSSQGMNELLQLIELQFRLNKLVVLDLQDDCSHLPSLDLDISNLIVQSGLNTRESQNLLPTTEGGKRMVLVGQLKRHQGLGLFVRPLDLILAASFSMANPDECLSTILNKLIYHRDPELGESLKKSEQELQAKQRQLQRMEMGLLRRLSALSHSNSLSPETNGGDLQDDLVEVLSELHRMSLQLKVDMVNLSCKLEELQRKQGEYFSLAHEAAQFYLNHLADLGNIDPFYHIPLEAYIHLMLETKTIDYRLIMEQVMRPMRPADRLKFREKVQSSNKKFEFKSDVDSLGKVIEGLLGELELGRAQEPRLMVVLHEATKSSPLLELEEILRFRLGKRLSYNKIYGTASDSGEGLETSLIKLISNSRNNPADSTKITCLCIANAHLSSRWINGRLIDVLKSAGKQTRVLVILVVESNGCGRETNARDIITTSEPPNEFDQELIDHVHVRYWHDELALNLSARFNLLQSALPTPSDGSSYVRLMVKKLILFHVVCQELTRAKECNIVGNHCWLKNYSFDYNQLVLTYKSLLGLLKRCQDRSEEQLAPIVCRYLDNIIYGPRMESLEDERLLSKLARHFILNPNIDAINSFLAQVESGDESVTTIDCVSMLINEGGQR